jgi:hypothetical protein
MLAFAYPRKYMNTNERERHPRYYAKELFDGVVVERVGRQIEQGCVGRCSRFINEYKLSYVHPRQCFSPCSPRLLHVLALLLAGMQSAPGLMKRARALHLAPRTGSESTRRDACPCCPCRPKAVTLYQAYLKETHRQCPRRETALDQYHKLNA